MEENYINKSKTELNFGEFKKLDYADGLPFEYVLIDLLYKKQIDVNFILNSYTKAIELAKYRSDRQFDEACVNLMALLDNISKEEQTRPKLLKRAIHILNTNKRFVPHTYDEKYNYTDEDEKEWDKFFEEMYGSDLKQ